MVRYIDHYHHYSRWLGGVPNYSCRLGCWPWNHILPQAKKTAETIRNFTKNKLLNAPGGSLFTSSMPEATCRCHRGTVRNEGALLGGIKRDIRRASMILATLRASASLLLTKPGPHRAVFFKEKTPLPCTNYHSNLL